MLIMGWQIHYCRISRISNGLVIVELVMNLQQKNVFETSLAVFKSLILWRCCLSIDYTKLLFRLQERVKSNSRDLFHFTWSFFSIYFTLHVLQSKINSFSNPLVFDKYKIQWNHYFLLFTNSFTTVYITSDYYYLKYYSK